MSAIAIVCYLLRIVFKSKTQQPQPSFKYSDSDVCFPQNLEAEHQDMATDDTTRLAVKTELLQRVEALGLQQALFPSQGEPIDAIVQRLESLNPIPNSLHPDSLPSLLGNW